MNLVKLPNGNWVNPSHVSSIEIKMVDDRPKTTVNVDGCDCVGSFKGDIRDQIATTLLNHMTAFSTDEQMTLVAALKFAANSEKTPPVRRKYAQRLFERLTKEWPGADSF